MEKICRGDCILLCNLFSLLYGILLSLHIYYCALIITVIFLSVCYASSYDLKGQRWPLASLQLLQVKK